jgi:hypothetical protein
LRRRVVIARAQLFFSCTIPKIVGPRFCPGMSFASQVGASPLRI